MTDTDSTPPKINTIAMQSMSSGTVIGMPLSVFVIWYLDTFVYPGKIPVEVATAAGAVIAQVVAVAWHIFQQLLSKAGINT